MVAFCALITSDFLVLRVKFLPQTSRQIGQKLDAPLHLIPFLKIICYIDLIKENINYLLIYCNKTYQIFNLYSTRNKHQDKHTCKIHPDCSYAAMTMMPMLLLISAAKSNPDAFDVSRLAYFSIDMRQSGAC